MKFFQEPEMKISKLLISDVITTSGGGNSSEGSEIEGGGAEL